MYIIVFLVLPTWEAGKEAHTGSLRQYIRYVYVCYIFHKQLQAIQHNAHHYL